MRIPNIHSINHAYMMSIYLTQNPINNSNYVISYVLTFSFTKLKKLS